MKERYPSFFCIIEKPKPKSNPKPEPKEKKEILKSHSGHKSSS